MKVILISGKAQHGKDTLAGYLLELLRASGYRAQIVHYGDRVKDVCRTFFGWDGKKDTAGRGMLQRVGTDVIRKQEPNFWVDSVVEILKFFEDEWDYVLIPDCRFPNEIQGIYKAGFPMTHIRIVRPDFNNGLTDAQKAHPSETSLDSSFPDICVTNEGNLADMSGKAVSVAKMITHPDYAWKQLKKLRRAIAIDFDGCLCKYAWPDIGEPNWSVIREAKQEIKKGTALILWTCREGDKLQEAIEACKNWGLTFDAVNENLPERKKYYGNDSRKIGADEYWDDRAVHKEGKENG